MTVPAATVATARPAIRLDLLEHKREARFIFFAEKSWNEFEQTGLHITLEDAKSWAQALKTNPKATLPRCYKSD